MLIFNTQAPQQICIPTCRKAEYRHESKLFDFYEDFNLTFSSQLLLGLSYYSLQIFTIDQNALEIFRYTSYSYTTDLNM